MNKMIIALVAVAFAAIGCCKNCGKSDCKCGCKDGKACVCKKVEAPKKAADKAAKPAAATPAKAAPAKAAPAAKK